MTATSRKGIAIPNRLEILAAIIGLLILIPAIILDKHLLVFKVSLSITLELLIIYLAFTQFRQRIIDRRRVLLALIIVVSLFMHGFLLLSNISSISYTELMYFILSQIPVLLLLTLYAVTDAFSKSLNQFYRHGRKHLDSLFICGMLLCCGLIFFYSPLTIHSSDFESLPFPLVQLILWHLLYCMAFVALTYLFYRTRLMEMRGLIAPLAAVIGLSAWLYTYILPGDYGHLDVTLFSNPGSLLGFDRLYGIREKLLQIAEIVLILITGCGLYYLVRKFSHVALWVLIALNFMVLGQTAMNVFVSPELWRVNGKSAYLPENARTVFRLSRDKNVLLFMMDMFTGGFIPEIFESYPRLRASFEGFVWYPNTISLGTATFAGLPGILGGDEFAPHNVNNNPGIPMKKRLSEAYGVYSEAFNASGYEAVYVNPVYFNLEEESDKRNITVVHPESFAEYWLSSDEEALELNLHYSSGQYALIFSVIGLFKACPFVLRPFIYTQGKWLNINRGELNIRNTVNHLAYLSLLRKLTTVDMGKPAFKFINNELTHSPWAIDKELKITAETTGGRRYFSEYDFMLVDRDGPYYASIRALIELANFFDWMRENEVFNESKIVIVSDHGHYGPSPLWPRLPVIRARNGEGVEGSAAYHSLLMVKNFNSEFEFKQDNRLMSTADTAAIILSALGDTKWIEKDPTRRPAQPREVVTTLTPVPPEKNEKDSYKIEYQFSISGDPSKPENWHQDFP